eukprot:16324360-Heterocapsa_arctica.AAC.1
MKVTEVAKHLGTLYHFTGSNEPELKARLTRALANWCTLGRFWHTAAITLSVRVAMFHALVISALLMALDELPHCMGATFQVKELRILMTGTTARHTNDLVRRTCHTYTVTSQLIAKQIRWLKSMMKDPSHNTAVLAAIA